MSAPQKCAHPGCGAGCEGDYLLCAEHNAGTNIDAARLIDAAGSALEALLGMSTVDCVIVRKLETTDHPSQPIYDLEVRDVRQRFAECPVIECGASTLEEAACTALVRLCENRLS